MVAKGVSPLKWINNLGADKMADFKQIDEARKILGLDEEATLEEIKDAFRKLALKYHPDRCKNKDKKYCEEMFKKINQAKDVLLNYCANYRYSFKEKDVKKQTMDKQLYEHLKRFYDGWWGDLEL